MPAPFKGLWKLNHISNIGIGNTSYLHYWCIPIETLQFCKAPWKMNIYSRPYMHCCHHFVLWNTILKDMAVLQGVQIYIPFLWAFVQVSVWPCDVMSIRSSRQLAALNMWWLNINYRQAHHSFDASLIDLYRVHNSQMELFLALTLHLLRFKVFRKF